MKAKFRRISQAVFVVLIAVLSITINGEVIKKTMKKISKDKTSFLRNLSEDDLFDQLLFLFNR